MRLRCKPRARGTRALPGQARLDQSPGQAESISQLAQPERSDSLGAHASRVLFGRTEGAHIDFMSYEWFIALRYLRARRREAAMSVNTAIAVAGIALGVAALIVALALMVGFRSEVQDKIPCRYRSPQSPPIRQRRYRRLPGSRRKTQPGARRPSCRCNHLCAGPAQFG